jgi:hypothetical protein
LPNNTPTTTPKEQTRSPGGTSTAQTLPGGTSDTAHEKQRPSQPAATLSGTQLQNRPQDVVPTPQQLPNNTPTTTPKEQTRSPGGTSTAQTLPGRLPSALQSPSNPPNRPQDIAQANRKPSNEPRIPSPDELKTTLRIIKRREISIHPDIAKGAVACVDRFLRASDKPSQTGSSADVKSLINSSPAAMCLQLMNLDQAGGLEGFNPGYYTPNISLYNAINEHKTKPDQQEAIRIAKRFSARFYLLSVIWEQIPHDTQEDIIRHVRSSLSVLFGPTQNSLNEEKAEEEFQNVVDLFAADPSTATIKQVLKDPLSLLTESR